MRSGRYVALDAQDRSLWDQGRIRAGLASAGARRAPASPRRVSAAGRDHGPADPGPGRRVPPTGRRSPSSTAPWAGSTLRRWSSSTARSPSAWPPGRRPAWSCSSRCSPIRRSSATSRCTRRTPSCSAAAGDAEGADARVRARDRAQRQRRRARRARAAPGRAALADLRGLSKTVPLLRRVVEAADRAATSTRARRQQWTCPRSCRRRSGRPRASRCWSRRRS